MISAYGFHDALFVFLVANWYIALRWASSSVVERLICNEKVRGPIPRWSTTLPLQPIACVRSRKLSFSFAKRGAMMDIKVVITTLNNG